MKKTVLEIYAMLVCFVSLTFLTGFLCSGIYNTVKLVVPEVTFGANNFRSYADNNSFCDMLGGNGCYTDEKRIKKIPDADITKMREEKRVFEIAMQKHEAMDVLIWCFIFMPISTIFFFIHWGIARKARQEGQK
jgi:hypothetical protein